MDYLKDVLKQCSITHFDLMELLNIRSRSTIYLKLNGKSKFTTNQAVLIKNYINERSTMKYTLEELFGK